MSVAAGPATGAAAAALAAEIDGPRAATAFELGGALDLANLVLRTLGTPPGQPIRPPSIGSDYAHVYHPENLDNIRVCTHRGRVVCSVAIYPSVVQTPIGAVRVGGINALVTHPDYRRLGLASRVMQDAHQRMRSQGLHIGQLGTRIQDFYRKLGWESAGSERIFAFDRGNLDLLPAPDAGPAPLVDDWQPYTDDLVRLHLAEPVHSVRDAAELRRLFEHKLDTVLLALDAGTPVAYVGLRGASVIEHAGPPARVAGLLHAAFTRLDDPAATTSQRVPGSRATVEMSVVAPASSELGREWLTGGVPHTLAYQGSIKLVDPVALLAQLGLDGQLAVAPAAAPAPPGSWACSWQNQSAALDERALTRLLFGPERPRAAAPAGFATDFAPIDYFLGPVDRV